MSLLSTLGDVINNVANVASIATTILAITVTIVQRNTPAARLERAKKIQQECQNFLTTLTARDKENIERHRPQFMEEMKQNLEATNRNINDLSRQAAIENGVWQEFNQWNKLSQEIKALLKQLEDLKVDIAKSTSQSHRLPNRDSTLPVHGQGVSSFSSSQSFSSTHQYPPTAISDVQALQPPPLAYQRPSQSTSETSRPSFTSDRSSNSSRLTTATGTDPTLGVHPMFLTESDSQEPRPSRSVEESSQNRQTWKRPDTQATRETASYQSSQLQPSKSSDDYATQKSQPVYRSSTSAGVLRPEAPRESQASSVNEGSYSRDPSAIRRRHPPPAPSASFNQSWASSSFDNPRSLEDGMSDLNLHPDRRSSSYISTSATFQNRPDPPANRPLSLFDQSKRDNILAQSKSSESTQAQRQYTSDPSARKISENDRGQPSDYSSTSRSAAPLSGTSNWPSSTALSSEDPHRTPKPSATYLTQPQSSSIYISSSPGAAQSTQRLHNDPDDEKRTSSTGQGFASTSGWSSASSQPRISRQPSNQSSNQSQSSAPTYTTASQAGFRSPPDDYDHKTGSVATGGQGFNPVTSQRQPSSQTPFSSTSTYISSSGTLRADELDDRRRAITSTSPGGFSLSSPQEQREQPRSLSSDQRQSGNLARRSGIDDQVRSPESTPRFTSASSQAHDQRQSRSFSTSSTYVSDSLRQGERPGDFNDDRDNQVRRMHSTSSGQGVSSGFTPSHEQYQRQPSVQSSSSYYSQQSGNVNPSSRDDHRRGAASFASGQQSRVDDYAPVTERVVSNPPPFSSTSNYISTSQGIYQRQPSGQQSQSFTSRVRDEYNDRIQSVQGFGRTSSREQYDTSSQSSAWSRESQLSTSTSQGGNTPFEQTDTRKQIVTTASQGFNPSRGTSSSWTSETQRQPSSEYDRSRTGLQSGGQEFSSGPSTWSPQEPSHMQRQSSGQATYYIGQSPLISASQHASTRPTQFDRREERGREQTSDNQYGLREPSRERSRVRRDPSYDGRVNEPGSGWDRQYQGHEDVQQARYGTQLARGSQMYSNISPLTYSRPSQPTSGPGGKPYGPGRPGQSVGGHARWQPPGDQPFRHDHDNDDPPSPSYGSRHFPV